MTRAEFDEGSSRWRLETADGGQVEVDVLVSACGQLSRPALTRIPGADRFQGPIFHTARWDHSVELQGKRVAVIGTGASTIQVVPGIADRVGRLDVYQRSAPYVIPKKDRPYRAWERRAFRWFPPARLALRFQPGVRELSEGGVVAEDGSERPADVIVLSTGFESTRFLAPMEIRGREGLDLNEAWRQGANAYLGMTVAGFPNLFIMYGPNTNLGSGSIIFQVESQMLYIVDAVRKLASRGGGLSVRPEVQEAFDREIQDRLSTSVWQTGCNNWYVDEHGRNTNNWPGFTVEYRWRTRRVDLRDYQIVNGARDPEPVQSSARAR